jgi:hypothetical protein
MKTKDFIRRVEELGYFINEYVDYYEIRDVDENLIAVTNKIMFLQLNTDYCQWDELCEIDKKELFDLLIEYAKTPIEDREEEKKFYLRHKYLQSSLTNPNNILTYSVFSNELALCNGMHFPKYKTQFTEKEIEEIKVNFDTDLKDFELVEVED